VLTVIVRKGAKGAEVRTRSVLDGGGGLPPPSRTISVLPGYLPTLPLLLDVTDTPPLLLWVTFVVVEFVALASPVVIDALGLAELLECELFDAEPPVLPPPAVALPPSPIAPVKPPLVLAEPFCVVPLFCSTLLLAWFPPLLATANEVLSTVLPWLTDRKPAATDTPDWWM
jgi:hypothetical protein